MTKQEHIEEMVSIMAASNNPFVDVPIEMMSKVAEALYNAGYRKLSKDRSEQEQSEKIVYGSLITSTKCYNCIHFPLCFAQKGGANLELASENDCCYYQSKLPEDSVVISKEELNKKYVSRGTYDAEIEYRKVLEKRVNKVTAEKIYLQAKAIVDATKHNRNFEIDDENS